MAILHECLGGSWFLDITGYYHKFTWGFTKEASPLYKLLKGSPHQGTPIQQNDNCEQAMNKLKAALTSADLLTHSVPWQLFVIDTDASGNWVLYYSSCIQHLWLWKRGKVLVSQKNVSSLKKKTNGPFCYAQLGILLWLWLRYPLNTWRSTCMLLLV